MTTDAVDKDLVTMIDTVLSRHVERRDTSASADLPLWDTLAELGLTRLTAAEQVGGSGATWREAAVLLNAMAYYDVRLPVAEHDLLAGWLLARAGVDVPLGMTTAAIVGDDGTFAGAFLDDAESVAVLRCVDGSWSVTTASLAAVKSAVPENDSWSPVSAADAAGFHLRRTLSRVAMMCGAMERVVDLCVLHTQTRHQFGRPLARFQAVQTMLADLTSETMLAATALDVAVDALCEGAAPDVFAHRVAMAASVSSHAATVIVDYAHQLHGAIGTTAEHELHRTTLPILEWRAEIGPVRRYDEILTNAMLEGGQDIWAFVLDGAVGTAATDHDSASTTPAICSR